MTGSALEKASYEDLKKAAILQYVGGHYEQAFYIACAALKRPEAERVVRSVFSHTFPENYITTFNRDIKKVVFDSMREEGINNHLLFPSWARLLYFDQAYAPLFYVFKKYNREAASISDDEWNDLLPVLMDSFFIEGLRRFICADLSVEKILVFLRKRILLDFLPSGRLSLKHIAFIAPFAEMAFSQEYIWQESPEETAARSSLHMDDPLEVCVRALYQDCSNVDGFSLKLCAMAPYRKLMDTMVREPARQKDLAAQIQPLGGVQALQEAQSHSVQAMYEENPYPRWKSFDFPYKTYPETQADALIAGCGTGWYTAFIAKGFPSANIKAIDVSRSSLGYAAMMAEKFSLDNVSYIQCDILDVKKLGQLFDMINCTGVLHHMADPLAGWAALESVLKTGGAMAIALYSTAGRQVQKKAKEKVIAQGYPATSEGIKRFRADAINTFPPQEISVLSGWRDFYSVSELRDLVFHVREKSYDLLEIKRMLDILGLEMVSMKNISPPVKSQYNAMFPDDTEMKNIEYWHEFERLNPDTFSNMYMFVCARKGETISPVAQKFFTL